MRRVALLCLGLVVGAASAAEAQLTMQMGNGWSFTFAGNVNAFLVYDDINDAGIDPLGGEGATGIRTGLLPAFAVFDATPPKSFLASSEDTGKDVVDSKITKAEAELLKDVFGDGSVVVLRTPGHTPGHSSLLVRLKDKGPVILIGDLAHFQENYDANGVPGFNYDRAQTIASLERIKQIEKNLKATVIIQHDPRHIGKLPAFPAAAR